MNPHYSAANLKKYCAPKKDRAIVLLSVTIAVFLFDWFIFPLPRGSHLLLAYLLTMLPPLSYTWEELRIGKETISKHIWGLKCICRLDYKTAYVRSVVLGRRQCTVFSSIDLADKDNSAIKRAIREKKAIIFLSDPQMQKDFPDLFAREQAVRPPVSPDQ